MMAVLFNPNLVNKLMNPQQKEDIHHRLNQMEVEINSSQPGNERLKAAKVKFITWFNNLSTTGKLGFGGVAVVLGFVLVQAVLKLVAAVISLALLSLLVYVGYKFLVSNK